MGVERNHDPLAEIEKRIMSCTKCRLHSNRKHAVPGEGPRNAEIMIVGEAPGRMEDLQGRPFVGSAGRILDEMLSRAGLSRRDVYITNVVKCRPPNNRDPTDEEIMTCLPYLVSQIKILRPKLVIAVGRHAGRTLYHLAGKRWSSMAAARRKTVKANISGVETTIVVTYHPAAALYNPQLRKELESDFSGFIKREVTRVKEVEGSRKLGLDEWLHPDPDGSGEGPRG